MLGKVTLVWNTSHWSARWSAGNRHMSMEPSSTTKGWLNLANLGGKQNCGSSTYHAHDNCSRHSQRSYWHYLKVTDKEKTIGGLLRKGETTILIAKGIGAKAIQKRYSNGMIVCMTAYVPVASCLASMSWLFSPPCLAEKATNNKWQSRWIIMIHSPKEFDYFGVSSGKLT